MKRPPHTNGPISPRRAERSELHRADRKRRAFTHVGGPVELQGPLSSSYGWLRDALDVSEDHAEEARQDVHGFHSYPARLHPRSAARLVRGLARPGCTVLDPFCGSGTILIEARLAGCVTLGVDANPLAVELSRLKLGGRNAADRAALVEAAERVVAAAEARRAARAGASRRYPPADVALFEPHVLLELDGLKTGLAPLRDPRIREALELVLSAILTKVSRKRSDSSQSVASNRLASGYTIRLFRAKTSELARRFAEYDERLSAVARSLTPAVPPAFQVRQGDARDLSFLGKQSIDVVVTSPPYPGTYDYLAHHADRLRWLGLDSEHFARTEIGARRSLERLSRRDALAQWERDFSAALASMRRVLRPDGTIALVLADSILGGAALYADELTSRLATRAGLHIAVVASQERPHFHRPTERAFAHRPKREHVILLQNQASSRVPAPSSVPT